MVEDKIQEEVLYREGLAMGLDKDDTIVKRRMAQKMQFLAEDVAAAHEPSTAELKAWFDKNRDKFALPSRDQLPPSLLFARQAGQERAGGRREGVAKIAGQPQIRNSPSSLGDPLHVPGLLRRPRARGFAKEFGPQFAVALEKLKPGSWQGPIESGYGWHLVFVDTVIPGRIPAFEEIEPDVKTAWLGEQKAQAWQKAYADMRAKYTVLLPAPSDE